MTESDVKPVAQGRLPDPPAVPAHLAQRRLLDALAVLALVALGVALLWMRWNASPPELGKQIAGDLVNYFHPLNRLAAERLAKGELPLWNPDACSGIPLLATLQVAVFYPGTWLAASLPAEIALPRVLLLECLLGAWFCALFFLRWGVGALAAGTGGVLFAFTCLLGQTFWPPQVHTLVWLPWILLCVEALSAGWRWRWWLGLASGTALQLVAGFPQLAAYTFYLAAPYAVVRLLDRRRDRATGATPIAPALLGMASAVAVGAALAAVQLLPTLELTGLGARRGPLGPEEVHYLTGLAEPIAPFFANLVNPAPRLLSFDFQSGSGYMGTATLLLAAAGLACGRPRRVAWLLLAVGAVAVLLSFGYRGPTAPLYVLYSHLPTVGLFRTPERFRVLVFFCAIGLAVMGFAAVARGFAGTSPRRAALALGLAALVAVAVAALGGAGAAWRSLAAALLIGAAFALPSRRFVANGCAAGLLLLTLVDLGRATTDFGSLRAFPHAWSETFYDRGVEIVDARDLDALRERADGGRIALNRVWPMTPAPPIARVARVSCYEPLAPSPWPEFHRRMGGDPVWGQLLFDTAPARFETFHDVAGVRLSVTPTDLGSLGGYMLGSRWHAKREPPVPIRLDNVEAKTLINEDALPRAYQTRHFEVRGLEEAVDAVATGGFDFQTGVLLDRDPGIRSGAPGIRPARIARYEPERVAVEVGGEGESLLVLSDTFLPGWDARVDGTPTPILRANAFYRAVRVPPGAREVVFAYAPASLRHGAWLSLAGAIALVAIPLVGRRLRAARTPVAPREAV